LWNWGRFLRVFSYSLPIEIPPNVPFPLSNIGLV
jgi:hypothetical protein